MLGAAPKVVAIIAVAAFFALVPAQSSPGGGIPLGPDCHPEGGHGCGPSGPGFLTYDEALSAGLPVPEIDPSLAMCGASTSDGFETLAEEEAVVDWNAEPTCQVDPREADYPRGVAARHVGYHHVGPETANYTFHGVAGSAQSTNPPVDRYPLRPGYPQEHVLGRVLAEAPSGAWVEAG